ncbi:MAG TPA: 4-hydroxy-2-oxovalerate aldolase, partial [Clostridia bacterium]
LEAVLQKYGCSSGADLYKLMDAAQETADMLPVNMLIDKYSLTLGYAGVYGSFYLHALRAAKRFGLDARDILVELGRMKTVGGQEDMILDVAWRMSRKGETHD